MQGDNAKEMAETMKIDEAMTMKLAVMMMMMMMSKGSTVGIFVLLNG